MVTTFLEFLNYVKLNQPGKWSGYAVWGNDGQGTDYLILETLLFLGEKSEAEQALKIFDDMAKNHLMIIRVDHHEENHKTWLDWHGSGTDPVGSSSFLGSRLILKDYVATEEAR